MSDSNLAALVVLPGTAPRLDALRRCDICNAFATREYCYAGEPWTPYCVQHPPQYVTAGDRAIYTTDAIETLLAHLGDLQRALDQKPSLEGLIATARHYCGPEWGSEPPIDQQTSFLLAAIHHLGGMARDYALLGKRITELESALDQAQAAARETLEVAKRDNVNLQTMIEQVRLHKDEIAQLQTALDAERTTNKPDGVRFDEASGSWVAKHTILTAGRTEHEAKLALQAAVFTSADHWPLVGQHTLIKTSYERRYRAGEEIAKLHAQLAAERTKTQALKQLVGEWEFTASCLRDDPTAVFVRARLEQCIHQVRTALHARRREQP